MPFALYNALLCLLTAAVLALACLCVEAAEERFYLKWDVSADRVSELSEYTMEKLNTLSQDVVFYPVYSSALSSDLRDLQTETLLKMAAVCERVRVEEIDANTQPQKLLKLAGETEGVADGTVFVSNGDGTRVVRLNAEEFLFSRRIEEEIFTIYCGEAQLIGAMERVCTENPVAVWFVNGHGEAELEACGQFALQLRAMGFEVHSGTLDMIQPDPQDVLVMINPQTDLTGGETALIKAFLDAGGDWLLACGADTPFDHLPSLLALSLMLTLLMLHAGRLAVPVTAHLVYNLTALLNWQAPDLTGSIACGVLAIVLAVNFCAAQPKIAHQPMKKPDGLIAAAAIAVLVTLYFI